MRKIFSALLCGLILAGAGWAANEVTVKSFSPEGEVTANRPQFTVVFSGDVVKSNQLNKPLTGGAVPLKFRPALAGTAKWVKTNQLVFTPSANLQPATRYDADFGPGGLRTAGGALVAGRQSFTFHRPALSFDRVTIIGTSPDRELTLRLDFNAEVSPVRLRGFLKIFNAAGNSVSYNIQGATPAKEIIVRTSSIYGKSVKVLVEGGLLPDKGDLPQAGGLEATLNVSTETLVTDSNAFMNESGRGRIRVGLNNSVDLAKAKGFIELSPAVPFTLTSSYDGFNIEGDFAPRSRVTLTIRKGLTGQDAQPMAKDFTKAFIFPDMPSFVRFPAAGMFLTPAEAPRVAVESANIETLEVSAWRLYNNNVPIAALDLDDEGSFTSWAKPLGSKKYAVGGMVNETARRALDLASLGCEGEGVYLIEAKNGDPYTWDSARMLLSITDTALSARMYKRGLQVWANSISDCKPLAGAEVKVYSAKNQLLLTGTTDADGLASFGVAEGWQDDLQPSLVTVEKEGRLSFVKLSVNQLSGRDVDISGAPWNDAYDGMWILPRALWQPGETLEAEAIVRSTVLDLPGEFPLNWSLSARGIDLASGVMKLDADGTGVVSVPIPATVDSGSYSLRLTVPGTKTVVAERAVQIEEFRPPQIETKLQAPKALYPGQEATLELSARYLFGGSGAGLAWELDYTTVPEAYVSGANPGYVFGSEMGKDAGRSSGQIASGELDENGAAQAVWTPEEDLNAPSIVRAHLRLNVMEANGRWTGSTVSVPIYPTKALIGVMAPKAEVRPNSSAEIGLVAVDPDDKPVNLGEVAVEISKVTSRYVMVSDDSGSRMTWQEEFSEPVTDKVTLNGKGKYVFTPKDEGEYRLTFTHADGRASLRLWAWENWTGSASMGAVMPDRVELKSDKESYLPGASAQITVKSPFAGRAILAVGSDRPMTIKSFDMTDKEMTVDVPVTEELLPNGWITIQVVRPESVDTKPPYRALGALPLKLDLSDRRLNVSVEAPAKAEPGVFSAKIRVTDAKGQPAKGTVSVALVDRGILLLSGSDNADPWKYFTRRRGMDGKMCDIYDSLLPIEARGTALLHPAGGDDAEMYRAKLMANADMMSPVRASDYKPLSIWLPAVELKDGAAEITTQVPEFAGALRVEAIAVDGVALGRAESESKIARPVVIDLTLPRFAAPGDQLQAALNVTAEQGGSASAVVTPAEGLDLNFNGQSEWKDTIALTANKRLELTSLIPTLTARSASEHGALKASVSLGGRDYASETGLAIRPGWPLTSVVGGGSAGEGSTEVVLPDDWYPGTGSLTLTISGAPVVDAVSLLETVDTWGFGLDRLVSRGWITLNMPSLLSDEDQDLVNPIENRIAMNTVLAGLASYQLYDGSWSAWRGDGTDAWGSVAALHLLTAVKAAGVIDPSGLNAGTQWLRRYMAEPLPEKNVREAMNARAYGAYVLALGGEAPLGWMNWLEERIGDLSGSGRALLAASYALAGDQEKAQALAGSESSSADAKLSLPEAGFRMLALDAIEPGGAPSRDLAARIAAELAKGSGRRNARDAGSMIMALGVFSTHVVPGPVTAKLFDADGNEVAVFDGKPAIWRGGKGGTMKLEARGAGSIWYSWTASGVPDKEPRSYSRGLRVERSFVDAKSGEVLNLSSIAFGQEAAMKIKVTATSRPAALRLSALLPAGFEAVSAGEMTAGEGYPVRSDLRFDRLLLHIDGQGKNFEWKLPLRAVYRGTFSVPPISVEALGNKGIGYLGKSETVTIQ